MLNTKLKMEIDDNPDVIVWLAWRFPVEVKQEGILDQATPIAVFEDTSNDGSSLNLDLCLSALPDGRVCWHDDEHKDEIFTTEGPADAEEILEELLALA